jgi:Putative transposase
MIVPGGGISPDGQRWVSCRPGFFLSVRVLSRLFRRLFLKALSAAHEAGRLSFFGNDTHLTEAQCFAAYLAPLRKTEWVVYAKRPFGGPEAVLAYLSRHTHRVAIANSRLIAFDQQGVTFKWKDYRVEGPDRYKCMTLATDEFIRRFLIHVLPKGLHRIRHYGLFAKNACADNIVRARELLALQNLKPRPPVPPQIPASELSVLRWPHDHHRSVRARCNAMASADSSNEPHQGRHLVTASQSCKSTARARRRSTGHGRAHSHIRPPSQIARQLAQFDAIHRSLIGGFTVARLVRPARSQSMSSPAALKSP